MANHSPTWAALKAGDTLLSRRLAMQTLRWAGSSADPHAQAIAYLQLAQADLLDSSFDHAMSLSRKAGEALISLGDDAHAVEALCLAAYCATVLGQNEAALALLAHGRRRAQCMPAGGEAALALARTENYAGIAACWGGHHRLARDHFASALEHLLCAGDLEHALQPLLNLWKSEVVMLTLAGDRAQDAPQPEHLHELQQQCAGLMADHAITTFSASQMTVAHTMMAFLSHHLCLQQARLGEAQAHLQNCRRLLRPLHASNWLHPFGWWAELLHALALGEPRTARYCALSLLASSGRTRHVPMQRLSRDLVQTLAPDLA